ncbi:dixin isoform X2 [Passer montanus]|uniref:dixin isoform X2 n=1 Tax=Passer montanus TaxID=9160 RepID=UPI001960CBB3|nr:dixin isoform X2 [Passer montanus]
MGTLMGTGPCHPPQPPAASHQLQAYVAWVNSQLRKKPALRPVQDLRQDLRDGVTLALLIEIVAGEKLSGIELNPSSQQEMRENVEKVLQFVASRKIRMHQTSAKDIVEGNLKSTMRLILALAAHFKPGSGRAGPPGSGGRSWAAPPGSLRPRSAAAVAQGAVAALADVRQDVQQSGRDLFRHRHRNSSMDEEIENPCWSVRALVQQYEGQQHVPLESHLASLTSPSPVHSAKSESTVAPSEEKERLVILQAEETEPKPEEAEAHFQPEWQAGSSGCYLENSWEEQLLEQQDHLEKEMEEAKKMISGLQALLLNGSLPEDEQEGSFELSERGACPEEQLIIIRSRLDQSVEENQDLKKELLKYKQEARNLQGIKDALQQRLLQQDASVLQLKQELLRANMDKEELHNQNVDLQRKVEERNRLLAEYKKELCQKDRHLQQQQTKLDEVLRQLSEASYQQVDLERELEHKEALLAHCMKREAEEVMAFSSHSAQSNGFLQPAGKGAAPTAHRGPQEQLQRPRPAAPHHRQPGAGHLQPHGAPAPPGDAQEAGEEGKGSPACSAPAPEGSAWEVTLCPCCFGFAPQVRGKSPASRASNECRDSWPPKSKLPHSQSTPVMSTSACTKVLYFTDRSLTPFMVSIPKRLGEVTLKDFKAAIDREGAHRYHFKALDPEFGTVKEEVFHDDDIIPGWEGKIVAWVEEDHGEN